MGLMKIEERAGRMLSLEGKVAMVTGAASGIGRRIAFRLTEMGALVALLDIDDVKGRESAAEIEAQAGAAVFLNTDVRSAAECRRAVGTVIERSGRIDILCNCAGVAIRKDVIDLTEDEWDLRPGSRRDPQRNLSAVAPSRASHDSQRRRQHCEHRLGMVAQRRSARRILIVPPKGGR